MDGTSWGGRGTESANTASQPARRVTSQGGGKESRSCTWWGSETGVCVWAHGEGSGPRASRGCGGHGTPAQAVHNAMREWVEPDPVQSVGRPRQPLWGGDREGGGRGGGCGRHTVRGPGRTPPTRGRRRTGGDAASRDEGAVWRSGGSGAGRGATPQLWTAHPRGRPQNIPIRASKGMTCPNLREIGSGRGWGFSLVVFPTSLLLV